MNAVSLKKKYFIPLTTAMAVVCMSGCAVIAGKEDADRTVLPQLNINFVETLRNQESLRGESYRDVTDGAGSAGLLQRPGSVYADQFRVYVTDTAPARVIIFDRGDRTASALNITPPPSSTEGKLLAPSGIAVDGTGVIFVSDAQQGRVFGYDRNGTLLMVLGRAQVMTSSRAATMSRNGLGDLSSPAGLAADNARNRLYVADKHAQQVKVFTTMGEHLFDIGNTGKRDEDFKFPEAVSLDRNGNIYVLDSLRLRVFIFDPDGKFMRSFSLKDAVPGHSIKPKGIALDSDGHIYVTDAVNNHILIYNNDGSFLVTWGRTGRVIGDFWTPAGIFIDDRDYIYIADQTNSRIQTFQYIK